MPNKDYTHIMFLLDRSGSMEMVADDVVGGINAFLQEQQQLPGKASISLIQFDSVEPHELIWDFKDLAEVEEITNFVPRGGTPLLDSFGLALAYATEKLDSLADAAQPANVVFVCYTDGQENSSREFTKHQIAESVTKYESDRGWAFVFLGQGIDAFEEAGGIGIHRASSLSLGSNPNEISASFGSLGANFAAYRRSGRTEELEWTEQQREEATDEDAMTKL